MASDAVLRPRRGGSACDQRRGPCSLGSCGQGVRRPGIQACRGQDLGAHSLLRHRKRCRAKLGFRLYEGQAGPPARPSGRSRGPEEERRARQADTRAGGSGRRNHDRLLDGALRGVHDPVGAGVGTVPGLLAGRGVDAGRVRRVRPAHLPDHLHIPSDRRTRVHTLRIRSAGPLRGGRHLAAGHQLVRRDERD